MIGSKMINILLATLFMTTISEYTVAVTNPEKGKTDSLHHEVGTYDQPHLTQENHPTIYDMVDRLVKKAGTSMPRYITTDSAQRTFVDSYGGVHRYTEDMETSFDLFGDLYISREILTNLSYEEIEGVIAIAIAEQAINKARKMTLLGTGIYTAELVSLYALNRYYDLGLGSGLWNIAKGCPETEIKRFGRTTFNVTHDRFDGHTAFNMLTAIGALTLVPSLISVKLLSNNLQKQTDLDAAKLVGAQNVIRGAVALHALQEQYTKENIFSRLVSILKLKEISDRVFYPIRAYNLEERVRYLSEQAAVEATQATQ